MVLLTICFSSIALPAAESPHAGAGPNAPSGDRIIVTLDFIAVGEGSRPLDRHDAVIDVGMDFAVEKALDRRGAAGTLHSRCRVSVETAPASGGRIFLVMQSTVDDREGGQRWERERQASLFPGTSFLVEIAGDEKTGERLVVSVTVRPAGTVPLDARPQQRVELRVGVYVKDGERQAIVQEPRLRTLTGGSASFAFDYPVPASVEHRVDHVRIDVTFSLGHLRRGLLPLHLALNGTLPGPDGPVPVGQDESTMVAMGQAWVVPVAPLVAGGPQLRLEVAAVWRGADGQPVDPL